MHKPIFDLMFSHDRCFTLEGPEDATLEQLEALCGSLLPQAAFNAVIKFRHEHLHWVYWKDVIDSLLLLLDERGYHYIDLPTYRVDAASLRIYEDKRLGYAARVIEEYNKEVDKRYAEQEAKYVSATPVKARRFYPQIMK
jgi:hypothetical protein